MNRFGIRFLAGILVLTLSHLVAAAEVVIHVSPDGDDANDGSSWAAAKRTIGAAVSMSSPVPGEAREIWVARGIWQGGQLVETPYTERIRLADLDGIALYGGFDGTEMSVEERSSARTVIDNAGTMSCLVLTGASNVTVDGFVFRHGGNKYDGSAVLATGTSNVVIRNCVIEDSHAGSGLFGGGLYAGSGELRLEDVQIRQCSSTSRGGGAYFAGTSLVAHRVTVENCTAPEGGGLVAAGCVGELRNVEFRNNIASGPDKSGGGVLFTNVSGLAIYGCFFYGNEATYGAALDCKDSTASIVNCVFAGNRAIQSGALLFSGPNARPHVLHCTIADNEAVSGCPAVYSRGGAKPTLRNSIVAYNQGLLPAIGRDTASSFTLGLLHVYGNVPGHFLYSSDVNANVKDLGIPPGYLSRSDWAKAMMGNYCPMPTGVEIDRASIQEDADAFGAHRPVAGRLEEPWPDVGAFEYQAVEQRVELSMWLGSRLDRDQSELPLQVSVQDTSGRVELCGEIPQGPDGFYYLVGPRFTEGSQWKILIWAPGYVPVRLLDPGSPDGIVTLAAAYSTGLDLVLYPGDVDCDGDLDVRDLNNFFINDWSAPYETLNRPGLRLDLNGDLEVNLQDLNMALLNFPQPGDQ